jgi:two-component system, sporulation sensor kinase E
MPRGIYYGKEVILAMPPDYFTLRSTWASLQYTIQKSHFAVLIVDAGETLVRCNKAFLQVTGYSSDEVEGLALAAVFHYQDSLDTMMEWQDGDEPRKSNVQTKTGNLLRTEFGVFKVDAGDGPLYIIELYDMSYCHGLSLLQQFAGTFLKDVNLGVILIDTDFRLIDISDTACAILGMEKERVIHKPMDEVFCSVPMEYQLVQRTILDGLVVRNHAISWMNDNARHELLMDSNLLKDNSGKTVGAYIIFKDVSNLRSLEEQVQRSDRLAMIGQIAAGTAHEIRNPLTSIKGFLQVLKKTFDDSGMDKEHGYTDIMLTEIDRINELVSEFLLLSKAKNVSYESVDVSSVMRDILPIINNEAILHGVTVQYQGAFELKHIVADRELLKQVCLNICKNGIEAMVEGGTLTITEKQDPDEKKVHVDIHDTGPGIPSFLIDKIFDPFFTTKENGTGLGLSVCQRIIHDIGGAIRVSSKGFGTTFTITVPYSAN